MHIGFMRIVISGLLPNHRSLCGVMTLMTVEMMQKSHLRQRRNRSPSRASAREASPHQTMRSQGCLFWRDASLLCQRGAWARVGLCELLVQRQLGTGSLHGRLEASERVWHLDCRFFHDNEYVLQLTLKQVSITWCQWTKKTKCETLPLQNE